MNWRFFVSIIAIAATLCPLVRVRKVRVLCFTILIYNLGRTVATNVKREKGKIEIEIEIILLAPHQNERKVKNQRRKRNIVVKHPPSLHPYLLHLRYLHLNQRLMKKVCCCLLI